MERRTLAAFLLVFAFFMLWSYLQSDQEAQHIVTEEVRDEKQISYPDPDKTLPPQATKPSSLEPLVQEESALEKVQINNYYVTYSAQGGYIRAIAIDWPENRLPFKNLGFEASKQDVNYKATVRRGSIEFYKEGLPTKKFNFGNNVIDVEGVSDSSILLFSFYLDFGDFRMGQRYFETFYFKDGSIHRTRPHRVDQDPLLGVEFGGGRSEYYVVSLLRDNYDLEWIKNDDKANLYLKNPSSSFSLYVGPQSENELEAYHLESIIYYGFWHFLAVILIRVLSFFYGFLNSWGLSIIFLSFLVYFTLFPLTSKSYKAMRKMQELQPLMQEIREKYKDKPQKMQKETLEIYKKHKVNPLGGCLPLFLQAPIFIAFYQVVFRFAELKGASFLWIDDLAMADRFFRLPFTVPVLGVEYFNLLPVLLVALGMFQQHVMASSANPQQKKMGLFMGVFMGVIFYNFPAALVLYFFVQNILTLAYQARLKKIQVS